MATLRADDQTITGIDRLQITANFMSPGPDL